MSRTAAQRETTSYERVHRSPAQLDLMLDAWEEAVTKEGEDLWIAREWEKDALKFVADMMLERSDVDEMMNK